MEGIFLLRATVHNNLTNRAEKNLQTISQSAQSVPASPHFTFFCEVDPVACLISLPLLPPPPPPPTTPQLCPPVTPLFSPPPYQPWRAHKPTTEVRAYWACLAYCTWCWGGGGGGDTLCMNELGEWRMDGEVGGGRRVGVDL